MNYFGVIFYISGIIAGIIIFFYLIGIRGISNDKIGIIEKRWSPKWALIEAGQMQIVPTLLLAKDFNDKSSEKTVTQLAEKMEQFKQELLSKDKGNNTKG